MTTEISTRFEKLKQNNRPYDAYAIAKKLYDLTLEVSPEIEHRIKYKGIFFGNNEGVGLIYTYANHCTYEFSQGFRLSEIDIERRLEGTGKYRRHLTFSTLKEVEEKETRKYIKQALSQRTPEK